MNQIFDAITIEELIDKRRIAREEKLWNLSDQIRDYLDTKLVFIFDSKQGQGIYYLTPEFFKVHKMEYIIDFKWARKKVESSIQKNIRADKNFDAWLTSMNHKINSGNDT